MSMNSKTQLGLLVSQFFAILALGLTLTNDLGFSSDLGISVRTIGITALLSAIVAYFVARKRGSIITSIAVLLAGILDTTISLQAAVTSHSFGPDLGVAFGAIVLLMGISKLWITWKSNRPKPVREQVTPAQKNRSRVGISKTITLVIIIVLVVVAAFSVILVSSGSGTKTGNDISCGNTSDSSALQIAIISGASNPSNAPGYSPDKVTLVIGVNNTVTWTNDDTAAHTVTTSSAPTGGSFNSGNMNQGATYTCTFTTPGTYQYYCKYHSWMTGTILVESG
jgi:plastocyanin